MSVGVPPGSIPSQDRYRIEFQDRPLARAGVEGLLDRLYEDLVGGRGRYYARWALSRWRDQLGEQGAWLALCGDEEVGFVTVRSPSPRKGEMTLLYATEDAVGPGLVAAALQGFRGAGMDLVTTSFQSWDHALERDETNLSRALDALGFGRFDVCVLEADPQRSPSRPVPPVAPGFRLRGLLVADLPECAGIMSRSPDLLMEEVRYPVEECERILRRSTGPTGRFAPDLAGAAIDPDGEIAGFATANSSGVIGQVYVLASHRRRGLGRALVDRALRGFAGRGIERAILTAIAGNDAAFGLYSKLGFRESYRYPLRYWRDRARRG